MQVFVLLSAAQLKGFNPVITKNNFANVNIEAHAFW